VLLRVLYIILWLMKNKRNILLIVFVVIDICLVIFTVYIVKSKRGDFKVHENTSSLEYIVEEGDTLKSIALKYSVSAPELAKSNNLKGDVKVGQVLKISAKTGGSYMTVKEGDTLKSIAYERWTDVETLKELNSLSSEDIEPGIKLFVPHVSIIQ